MNIPRQHLSIGRFRDSLTIGVGEQPAIRPLDCQDRCDAAYRLCKHLGGSEPDCANGRDACYLYCGT